MEVLMNLVIASLFFVGLALATGVGGPESTLLTDVFQTILAILFLGFAYLLYKKEDIKTIHHCYHHRSKMIVGR